MPTRDATGTDLCYVYVLDDSGRALTLAGATPPLDLAVGQIGLPLGTETGYWRPRPGNQVEVMLAHPTGIVEIYLGEITGTRIEMATDVVARTATAKEVTAGHRLYGLAGTDLAYAYDLAAVGQPLQPHLSAQLKRVSSGD